MVRLHDLRGASVNSWQAIEIGDAIDAVVALAVLLIYCRAFFTGFVKQTMTPVDWLISGICLTWFGTLIDRVWRLLWRIEHHPGWMQNSPVLLVSLIVVAIGGVMHISARSEDAERPIRRSWRPLAISFAIGAVIGIVSIWLTGPTGGYRMRTPLAPVVEQ
jgi:hypothetical protein